MRIISEISVAASLLFAVACHDPQPGADLVPLPAEMTFTGGYFQTDSVSFARGVADGRVVCELDASSPNLSREGYGLEVRSDGIRITAADSAGLFYARQTLLQLLTAKGIPCVKITDNPRFGYRGIHLDVSRHFFAKEEVFKILDEMARYKLNVFHLHLTDNGGWRIQIDRYPLLTRLGAFRTEADWLKWWEFGDRRYVPEGTPGAYGGYYTKDDIRQIVAYAAARYIEVIPEIEFPAHSDEVFIGYPELCCSGKPYTSGEFCVGNPATFEFMDGVLTEVMELFPYRRRSPQGRLENLPQMPVARQGAGWSGRSAVLPDRTCRKIPCRTRPDDGRVGRDTAEQSAAYVRCDFVPRTEGGYRSRQPRVRRGHVSGRNHLFRLVPG